MNVNGFGCGVLGVVCWVLDSECGVLGVVCLVWCSWIGRTALRHALLKPAEGSIVMDRACLDWEETQLEFNHVNEPLSWMMQ